MSVRSLRLLILLLALCLALPPYAVAQQDDGDQSDDDDQSTFTLGEVVVLGKRSPAQRTSFAVLIDAKDIKALGAQNVAEALAADSGSRIDAAPTSISANGKHESLVSLRGLDPRNVAVLVDGVPIYEPYFHVLDLSKLPVGDVASIRIARGASSVLYGPNTLGGAINIVTLRGCATPRTRLSAGYGDVNAWRGSARTSGAYKDFDYYLAPAFSTSAGYLTSQQMEPTRNEDGKLRNNSDSEDLSLSGRLGYSGSLGSVALSAGHYEFEGGVPFNMEAVDPSTLWRKDWRKSSVALHAELVPTDWLLLRSKLFYVRFYNTITTYENAGMSAVLSEGLAISTYDNDVAGFSLLPQF
ncbi:MAG: TonB-dependent receptor plug domain-containing protein, partial [Candidatus Alcyoniella australis]|nr:TonB-dependent receptor plug domain-containing protein [Candidatus Alcyoniella australis]